MSEVRPKPLFWIVVFAVAAALTGYALHKAGILEPWLNDKGIAVSDKKGKAVSTKSSSELLEISFYCSYGKKEWIEEMVKAFNAADKRVGGKSVRIKLFQGNSGEQLDDLRAGKIKPDIWSPSDESWLRMASEHWQSVKQKKLSDGYSFLIDTPLVIAIWEPMAKVLGYPNPIGWQDIAKVAANPKGWAAFGHPEWGKFRWGHAHPDANSGFLTIVSEVYAILGKTEGITPEDLKKPSVMSFLKEFEGAVEHYGLSNIWIDDLMHIKGPSYLSATVQYENTIIQTNEKNGNQPFKLVAIYPKEGYFHTRHPAAILKEDWVTPEKQEAGKAFIAFLLSNDAQTKAMQMGLRPIAKDAALSAPFDDAHGVVAKISDDKVFQVPDEVVLKRIRDLWEDVKVPATVVLILDRSGSMKGKPMENAKIGAIQFVRSMKPRDQLKIVVFHNEVSVLSEMCFIRECGESAISRLEGVFAEGGTALYDVIFANYKTLKEMKKKEPNRRYCMLVLSDGQDTSSHIYRHDFTDSLPKGEDYDVPKIYTIAYGPEADKDLMAMIANKTNGRLFSSTPEEIVKTYKELSANF